VPCKNRLIRAWEKRITLQGLVLILSLITLLVIVVGFGISYGSNDDKYRFEVGSSPYNVTYKDWAAKWWQWYVSVPKTHSPNNLDFPNHIQNQTCSVMQDPSLPVFFLFTPYVEDKAPTRTCDIPKGKAILIPIVSSEMDTGDPTLKENSTKALVDTATSGNNNALISVTLDGTKLDFNQDQKNRVLTAPFIISLPQHNIWEEKERPGKYTGVAEGYYLLLKPLEVGNHTLFYEAGTGEPNPNQYAQSVTYHLNVK
jgi:hypothetical protein